jgi:hypothetical protein
MDGVIQWKSSSDITTGKRTATSAVIRDEEQGAAMHGHWHACGEVQGACAEDSLDGMSSKEAKNANSAIR